MTPAAAEPLRSIAPTGFAVLAECPLRFSLDRGHRRRGRRTDDEAQSVVPFAAALGIVCHNVLERLVKEEWLRDGGLELALGQAWREEATAIELTRNLPPGSIAESRLARARLKKAAKALGALIQDVGDGTELICEKEMSARNGRLVGRPDLIVRGPDAHWIVDYKSGAARDTDGAPNEHYVSQVQLYAVLERERSGSWPQVAYVLPLRGKRVEVEIDPDVCDGLADAAVAALDDYNREVDGAHPAGPSPAHCRWCDWPHRCGPVWDAMDEAWAENERIFAAKAKVTQRVDSEGGGSTLRLALEGGSLGEGAIWVKGLTGATHPALQRAKVGVTVVLNGLRRDRNEGVYTLPATGLLEAV